MQSNKAKKAHTQGHKVFVGGLSVNCEDRELREYLQQFGLVVDCEIIRNKQGKSKGYCFASFSTRESQLRSLGKVHFLQGKVFEVREQLDSDKNTELLSEIAKRKLFISNLKPIINEDDLFKYFARFGAIEEVLISRDPATQQSKGFGFVKFVEECSTKTVLQGRERKNIKINNQEITIKQCIARPQMSRIKKSDSMDGPLKLFSSPDCENQADPFGLFSPALMFPPLQYNNMQDIHVNKHCFAFSNHAQANNYMNCQYYQTSMESISQLPQCKSPEQKKKSLSKLLSHKSRTFDIESNADSNSIKVLEENKNDFSASTVNTPGESPQKCSRISPIKPLTVDFSDVAKSPIEGLNKEELVKLAMEQKTAENSLVSSFASMQGSHPPSLIQDSLLCMCQLPKDRKNIFESIRISKCEMGTINLDQRLLTFGLLIRSTSLSQQMHKKIEPSAARRVAGICQSLYRPLHGFPVSSSKYKLPSGSIRGAPLGLPEDALAIFNSTATGTNFLSAEKDLQRLRYTHTSTTPSGTI